MQVQVLTVPDCPSARQLDERLAAVLAGRADVRLERRVIGTAAEAEAWGMHGSPTVLVDGRDPFAGPGASASLSCRLYRGADGRLQVAPSAEELRRVLGGPPCCESPECCEGPGQAVPAEGAAPARRDRGSARGEQGRGAVGVARVARAGRAGRAGLGRVAPVERGWRSVQQAVLRAFAETGNAPPAAVLERAAAPFGVPAARVLAELAAEDFLTLDGTGTIVAAYPFSAVPTGVEVILPGGVRVAAMCAIDALGIPAMLGTDAVIESQDPVSGNPVRVSFRDGVATWEPRTAAVFYGAQPETGPSADVCCGYLRFFAIRATAEAFAAAHPEAGGEILGQRAAQQLGEQIFGPLLSATP